MISMESMSDSISSRRQAQSGRFSDKPMFIAPGHVETKLHVTAKQHSLNGAERFESDTCPMLP
jgi:hypothetical protein